MYVYIKLKLNLVGDENLIYQYVIRVYTQCSDPLRSEGQRQRVRRNLPVRILYLCFNYAKCAFNFMFGIQVWINISSLKNQEISS